MALGGGTPYIPPTGGVGTKVPGVAPSVRTPGGKPQPPSRGPQPQKRPPVNRRISAAGKALGAHGTKPAPSPAKPKSPYIGGQIVDALGMLTRAQKQSAAGGINEAESARNRNIMETYGAKNKEIGNAEGTTANRLTGINQGTQASLGGLLQGAEGSAKTFDNQMAENSLNATKAVETAGQNALTSSGGYLDPQVRSELQAGTNYVAGIGAAATARAGELSQAGTNAIRNQAAAAVARGQENQNEARNRFFGERLKNTNAQNAELGRSAAKAKEERITLPKEIYTDIFAKNKIEGANANNAAKIQVANTKNALTARGQNLTREGRAETNQAHLTGIGMQQRGAKERGEMNNQTRREVANQVNAYRYAGLAEKERMDTANIAYKARDLQIKIEGNQIKAGKGAVKMTASQLGKYTTEFSQALSAFENAGIKASAKKLKAPDYGKVREDLARGYKPFEVEGGKSTIKKIPSVTNRIILQAAEEVWRTHYVSKATSQALESIGLPGSGWNATLKRG